MNINWLEIIIGDAIMAIVVSAIIMVIGNKQSKDNEAMLEKLIQERVDTLQQENRLILDKIDLSTQLIEKSVENGAKEETQ